MATKLYFHLAVTGQSGTFPAAFQADANAFTWTTNVSAFVRTMDTSIGTGQQSLSVNSAGISTLTSSCLGMFTSLPLNGAQTVGGGTVILNSADAEGNTNANFWINNCHIYVWRPSTGALVGHVVNVTNTASGKGGTEATAASSEQVTHITGITSSAVSAQNGDVVIAEIGGTYTQGMATSYALTFYFDGTTENTTENAVVSNHAAYLQLTETLSFQGPTYTPSKLALLGVG